jgi:hypothetical protein
VLAVSRYHFTRVVNLFILQLAGNEGVIKILIEEAVVFPQCNFRAFRIQFGVVTGAFVVIIVISLCI